MTHSFPHPSPSTPQRQVELLCPAGNFEKMEIAFHYGADAVYMGGPALNLRALADNFDNDELAKAVAYAHSLHKKVYVTLNVIPHNADLEIVPEYVAFLERAGVDAVIVADLGILDLVRSHSSLDIHISTQASTTNYRAVKVWKELGAKRVVLAREVNLDDIKRIKDKVPEMELEVFVHGAMCISISGRCLLSSWMANRDANRGLCTHSCRWKYSIHEERRPGQYFPIDEDERGTYILNSKDLCTVNFLNRIVESGVDSLKIEGRIKGIYHVAVTTGIYRDALAQCLRGDFSVDPAWMQELEALSNRGYTSGFYLGRPDSSAQNYPTSEYRKSHLLVAKVIEELPNNESLLEIRNRIPVGTAVEIVSPGQPVRTLPMPSMTRIKEAEESQIDVGHPNMIVRIKIEGTPLKKFDLLRALAP